MKHLLLAALTSLLFSPFLADAQDVRSTRPSAAVRIVLAGDSTVTDSVGWGIGFAKALNDSAECINLSKGGSSSKSFRDQGLWRKVLDAKPQYVLIQFGHNDQPGKGPERETDPATTYHQNMGRYVDDARAVGAAPILLTSLSRRVWAEDRIHIRSDLTPYTDAVKAVAAEKRVPLIDLHAWSIEVYQSLGSKGCELISPKKNSSELDNTHLNVVGSEVVGPYIAWELDRKSV